MGNTFNSLELIQLTSEKIVLDTTWHRCKMLIVAKKPTKKNMTWTPTVEDWKLMQELRAKTGIGNDTDVVRYALRTLAAKEGVAA